MVHVLVDDWYRMNTMTGEVYAHSRAYRRRETALGDKIYKHEKQTRPVLGLRGMRRTKRQMTRTSRRRNRRTR